MSSLTLENEAYVELLKYGGMLLVKLILMSPITALYRFIFKSFISEEDGRFLARNNPERREELSKKDPNVERVRAAHLNDLENLVPFFIVATFYVTTNPDPTTAGVLFKIFMAFRFAHTVIYLAKLPQPMRAVTFFVGMGINLYMGIATLVAAWTKRATSVLLKDPGFNIEAIGAIISDDPFSTVSPVVFEEKPTTSKDARKPRQMTTEGFSLRHREEVSEKEYEEALQTVLRIYKSSISTDHTDEPMDEENMCTICYANEISVSFTPCGHTSCKACISHQLMNSKECFFCKAAVEGYEPVLKDSSVKSA